MKNDLKFDFIVDRKNNTLTMKRKFLASRSLVWDCFTKSEFLEQWFAPKPLIARTKTMDFTEGGFWLYAMVEPNGTEHWGRTDYVKIQPIDFYTSYDAFSDENGNLNPDLPGANWLVTFKDLKDSSVVEMLVTYNSLSDLETIVEMGMADGMKLTLENLDELLSNLNQTLQ